MSSGWRKIQLNTNERLVSSDHNRLQTFAGQDHAELLLYMLSAYGNDDVDAGSVVTIPSAIENPLRGEIINGLLVRPQAASLNLNIDAGIVMMVSPDAAADESANKYIRDPGITGLAMTANASGSTRFDVIECQVNATETAVTASRDVYSASTDTFSATTVTKESKGVLTYRVRLGTPASGFPGAVSGWLPLCVAQVDNGVANTDTMVFWDVRPLISDRIFGASANTVSRPIPWFGKQEINATALATTGGILNAAFGGRRLGGRLRQTLDAVALTADADVVDLTAAKNRMRGFTAGTNVPWYLYLCTPYSLPRWARYTTSTPKLPRSPRGILVMCDSTIVPDADGKNTLVIRLPTPWTNDANGQVGVGLGVCVARGYVDGAGTVQGFMGSDAGIDLRATAFTAVTNPTPASVNGADTLTTTTLDSLFSFTPGTHFPAHAKWIKVDFYVTINAGTGTNVFNVDVTIYTPGAGGTVFNVRQPYTFTSTLAAGTADHKFAFSEWFPVGTPYPSATAVAQKLNVLVNNANANFNSNTQSRARISGYRL